MNTEELVTDPVWLTTSTLFQEITSSLRAEMLLSVVELLEIRNLG